MELMHVVCCYTTFYGYYLANLLIHKHISDLSLILIIRNSIDSSK
jgi:hypothetical protein